MADGARAVSVSLDHSIRVWDVETARETYRCGLVIRVGFVAGWGRDRVGFVSEDVPNSQLPLALKKMCQSRSTTPFESGTSKARAKPTGPFYDCVMQ